MKKLICLLSLVSLLFSNQIVEAAETNDLISNNIINKYDLEKVVELPNNIVPIYVENEQELIELLEQLEKEYSDNGITSQNSNKLKSLLSTKIIDNKTFTHTETIFDLSSIGGKIVSEVNYTYSYWIAPESYSITINYHDVYETGIYGFQEITYFDKSATENGSIITVNVRGNSKVYIGLSGGGASGNLVLKTFPFDKTYTIYPGLN